MTSVAFDARLAGTYDALWADGKDALATDRVQVEPLPVHGSVRWGISAVLRPRGWPPSLVACAAACGALIGPAGTVYGEDAFHVTLRAIEGHRDGVSRDDVDVAAYREVLGSLAADTAPIGLGLRGLTATAGGVLVQGWPTVDLGAFRHALYERLAERHLSNRGPETTPDTLRTTAHATLAIFEGRIARTAELVDLVAAHRETDFGTWLFSELWLVGYRRAAGRVALVEYDRITFGATGETTR